MTNGGFVGRQRILAAVLLMASAIPVVAGCGKAEFNYIANAYEKTYFRVPSAWSEVDGAPVDDVLLSGLLQAKPDSEVARRAKGLMWSAAYDASEDPTAEHVFSAFPTTEPVVYSMVFHLPQVIQGALSFDILRDFIFPVTTSSRVRAEQNGQGLSGFELLNDQVLTPSDGVRGIRVVYNYELGLDTIHTFDLTAYVNNDSSTVYLLLIRCTARCYRERAVELDGIATSFTVRSQV